MNCVTLMTHSEIVVSLSRKFRTKRVDGLLLGCMVFIGAIADPLTSLWRGKALREVLESFKMSSVFLFSRISTFVSSASTEFWKRWPAISSKKINCLALMAANFEKSAISQVSRLWRKHFTALAFHISTWNSNLLSTKCKNYPKELFLCVCYLHAVHCVQHSVCPDSTRLSRYKNR